MESSKEIKLDKSIRLSEEMRDWLKSLKNFKHEPYDNVIRRLKGAWQYYKERY